MSFEIQKQVRDNAEDLRTFLSDLDSWTEKLHDEPSGSKQSIGADVKSIPPVRNMSKKRESNEDLKSTPGSKVTKRISASDYDQWDKFDVEKACEDIDREAVGKPSIDVNLKLQDEAQYEKDRGNRFVKNGKWDDAIVCYSKAIKCYPKDATFYANRALCYLKKKQYRSVEADCTAALQLDSNYVKALQRRATARRELNQFEDALKDLNKALAVEPNNTALKADLAVIEKKLSSSASGTTKPKHSQGEKSLKWTPPIKEDKTPETIKRPSPSPSKPTAACAPLGTSDVPVEITPARKHEKSDQISVGEENDAKSKPKSQPPDENVAKEIPSPNVDLIERQSSPVQWFKKEGISVVEPILKPPHRRSKVSLKRLVIKECPNYDLNADMGTLVKDVTEEVITNKHEVQNEVNKIAPAEKLETENKISSSKDEKKSHVYKSAVDEGEKPGNRNKLDQNDTVDDEVNFTVPSTSVQFISTWKLIQDKPQMCLKFLKNISAGDLHKIFQDCLESEIFSGIIRTLEGSFIKEGVPVFEYLEGLSKVRRFSMLTMFMSPDDRKGLLKLFEHCQTNENCSEESVNTLKKIYDL